MSAPFTSQPVEAKMIKTFVVCLVIAAGQCCPVAQPAYYPQSCQPCAPACSCGPAPGPAPVYQVSLDNCGPEPSPTAPVQAPSATAPAIHKPTVTLPASIPATKIVGASASCVKTYLKPQLYHQLVSVPIISKYLQTLTRPVTEVITFNAIPICPPKCSPVYASAPPPCYLPAPAPLCLPPPPPACLPPPPPVCLPPPPPVCLPPPPPVCLPPPPPACIPQCIPAPNPCYY